MILLLSNQRDIHVDPVVDKLRSLGQKFVRLNTDDLAGSWSVDCKDCSSGCSYVFTNTQNGKFFAWSDPTAIWYRRPDLPTNLSSVLSEPTQQFAAREIYSLVQYLLSAAKPDQLRWVSNPHTLSRATSKFFQIQAARDAGFSVPTAIITNAPVSVREFVDYCNVDFYAIKRISSHSKMDSKSMFFTARLTRAELLENSEQVAFCPTLIQEYVPKVCEYRVTVIGDKVFTCRLGSQDNPAAIVDWREAKPGSIKHEMVSLPILEAKTLQTVKNLGLMFGAVDLIEKPDGEIVFVEVNPNGQWLWIEQITGADMTGAMAELLAA